jgi:hypothetical protein
VQAFTSATEGSLAEVLKHDRPLTRKDFLEAIASVLRSPRGLFGLAASWIHRLCAGVRLM